MGTEETKPLRQKPRTGETLIIQVELPIEQAERLRKLLGFTSGTETLRRIANMVSEWNDADIVSEFCND